MNQKTPGINRHVFELLRLDKKGVVMHRGPEDDQNQKSLTGIEKTTILIPYMYIIGEIFFVFLALTFAEKWCGQIQMVRE